MSVSRRSETDTALLEEQALLVSAVNLRVAHHQLICTTFPVQPIV